AEVGGGSGIVNVNNDCGKIVGADPDAEPQTQNGYAPLISEKHRKLQINTLYQSEDNVVNMDASETRKGLEKLRKEKTDSAIWNDIQEVEGYLPVIEEEDDEMGVDDEFDEVTDNADETVYSKFQYGNV
ncbi:hypothetical protein HDU76_011879, partial [Blyttiomyces sp. JEL0837]